MNLEPGMHAQTPAGNAMVLFVAHDDAGDLCEIVMKLDQPYAGYSFVMFTADDWPALFMVQ